MDMEMLKTTRCGTEKKEIYAFYKFSSSWILQIDPVVKT